jgi:hypothetical protein
MKKSVILILILASGVLSAPLMSQSPIDGPEEPEMLVPEVLLEIEDVREEQVTAPVPVERELPLPELSLPSPQAEAGSLSQLPLIPFIPDVGSDLPPAGADFFSEALVGGGVNNHLIGDIALYKLGEGPRFSLRFAHDGTDGYSGNASGTGFFDRSDLLEGSLQGTVRGERRSWIYGFDASYLEEELGFQGLMGSTRSVVRRSSSLSGLWRYPEEGRFDLAVEADYSRNRRLYSGSSKELEEQLFQPGITGSFRGESVLMQLLVSLRHQSIGGTVPEESGNRAGAGVLLEARLPFMEISGEAGIRWDFSGDLRYPFALQADGAWRELASFSTRGGFRAEEEQWSDYWSILPFWNGASLPPLRDVWFWEGSLELSPVPVFGVRGGWEFLYGELVPLQSDFIPLVENGGPFGLEEREGLSLSGDAEAYWSLFPGFTLGAGWKGWFFDQPEPLLSESAFFSYLEYSYREGIVLGRAEASMDLPSDQLLPWLDLSLSWRAAEGIVMSLTGSDLLEPFLDKGRIWVKDFIREGAQLTLQLKISL